MIEIPDLNKIIHIIKIYIHTHDANKNKMCVFFLLLNYIKIHSMK